jgi:hypothetical protein
MMSPQMATPRQLVRRYEEGRITSTGLILDVLNLAGKQRLTKMLEALPVDILEQLRDFVENYKPGREVFRGPRPKIQTVRFVREWFDCAERTVQTSKGKNGTS